MDWNDIEILHAIIEANSVSGAARRLGISQPKVSRRLRQAEETLGVRLFQRVPSGLVATAAVESLVPALMQMAAAAGQVKRTGDGLRAKDAGLVRIWMSEPLCRWLGSRLAGITNTLQGVNFELIVNHDVADPLPQGSELMIHTRLPDDGTLICRRLGGLAYAVYGCREYVLSNPAAYTSTRYAQCSWVGIKGQGSMRARHEAWLKERLALPPAGRSTDLSVVLEMVRCGVGLAVLPCFLGDSEPALVRVTAPLDDLSEHYYLLAQRDALRDTLIRHTADALIGLFKSASGTLLGHDRPAAEPNHSAFAMAPPEVRQNAQI